MPRGYPTRVYTIAEYLEDGQPTLWKIISRYGWFVSSWPTLDAAVAEVAYLYDHPEEVPV